MSLLSDWLTSLNDTVGERFTYVLVLALADAVPFFVLNVLSDLILRESDTNWFAKYRILPGQHSDPELTRKGIRHALFAKLVGGPIVLALLFGLEIWWNPDIVSPKHVPDWWTMLWQVVVCSLVEDTLLFWTHRMVHHPRLYAKVHKMHHDVHISNGWAANWQSDVDTLCTALIPVMSGPLLLRAHCTTRGLYIMSLVFESWVAHGGYAFPGLPFQVALRHNYHHSHNMGTYGLRYPFWDWLMGTDKHFRKWLANRQLEEKKDAAKKKDA